MARNSGNKPSRRQKTSNQPPQSSAVLTEMTAFSAQQTSGPIPNASELERYEQVLPGAADRILTMAEKNQQRRHDSDRITDEANSRLATSNAEAVSADAKATLASISEVKRGQWMAFFLALVYIGVTAGLAALGKEIAASAMTLGGLASIIFVLVRARKNKT